MDNPPFQNKKLPAWHEVEAQIQKEINWLRESIETFSDEEKHTPIICKECLMRRIAVLIASGKVATTEIKKSSELRSFWIESSLQSDKTRICHGQNWHRETMEKIESHFTSQSFDVVREPNLHWGRADLGVYKKGEKDLYIEVGTTSFFKLWMNLDQMRNFVYLIVLSDNKMIEFSLN